MTPLDDLLGHFLAVAAALVPFLGAIIALWQKQAGTEKRVGRLERLNRVQSRIVAGLLAELRLKDPEWEPGPTLAADMEELRRLEEAADG